MLDLYKDGKKQAEVDVGEYSIKEIELLLEIQEMMGRTWIYGGLINHLKGRDER